MVCLIVKFNLHFWISAELCILINIYNAFKIKFIAHDVQSYKIGRIMLYNIILTKKEITCTHIWHNITVLFCAQTILDVY